MSAKNIVKFLNNIMIILSVIGGVLAIALFITNFISEDSYSFVSTLLIDWLGVFCLVGASNTIFYYIILR